MDSHRFTCADWNDVGRKTSSAQDSEPDAGRPVQGVALGRANRSVDGEQLPAAARRAGGGGVEVGEQSESEVRDHGEGGGSGGGFGGERGRFYGRRGSWGGGEKRGRFGGAGEEGSTAAAAEEEGVGLPSPGAVGEQAEVLRSVEQVEEMRRGVGV